MTRLHRTRFQRPCWSLLGLFVLVGGAAQAQSITNLGGIPGDDTSGAWAMDADGDVVVGSSTHGVLTDAPWRWTRHGGLKPLPLLPGLMIGAGLACARNDDVQVGTEWDAFFSFGHQVRWTKDGVEDLGSFPKSSFGSYAYGVSGDGKVVVGYSSHADYSFASSRWTKETGMVDLGSLPGGSYSYASAVDGDGKTIVGASDTGHGTFHAVLYRHGQIVDLGTLAPGDTSYAQAITGNGKISGGASGAHAVLFTEHGIQDLGLLPGGTYASVNALSEDGKVAVASCGLPASDNACIWTKNLGLQDLNVLLPKLGVDLTGWHLVNPTGLSSDGKSIVGSGTFHGNLTAFLVKVHDLDDDDDK